MLFKLYQFYESKIFFAFIIVVWLILRLCFWVCILIMLEMRGVRVLQAWELMTFYQSIFVIDYLAQRIVKIFMRVLVYGPLAVYNICVFWTHFLPRPKMQLFSKSCVLGWAKCINPSAFINMCVSAPKSWNKRTLSISTKLFIFSQPSRLLLFF